jgi:putative DNA primase/helicase
MDLKFQSYGGAAEIAARLGLRRVGREWRGACPACGYAGAFALTERDKRALWWCANCRDQKALTRIILGDDAPAAPRDAAPPPGPSDKIAAALRLWAEAMPAEGSPVETYLRGRGLVLPERAPLRFLPMAKHPSGRRLPCMIALLQDAHGRPAGVHRTYLHIARDAVTKAKVDPVRMTLGSVRGAAVRLWPAAPRLVVGEGIETTIAAAALLRLPGWAAVSAGNLGEAIALPPSVREVTIAADADPVGQRAAEAAAKRWQAEGRRVRIAVPDEPNSDFNDLIQRRRGGREVANVG